MCGILGFNKNDGTLVKEAARTIAHRGPDAAGSWAADELSLGFRRLAIIDLDARANQPMWDEDGTVAIVYNGEIYNFKELRASLEREYAFRTTSDTEVLLQGYKKYGPKFVEQLRGMFAFAIYDTRKNKLFLFRDHAGIKPLYYFSKDGFFAFASEVKPIMHILGAQKIRPEIDPDALRTYFGLGFIPSPRTLYKDLHKLPRGAFLEFDLAAKKIREITPFQSPTTKPTTEAELFSLIETCALDHLVADVPVGLFFSGGTDSSVIASILHAHGINLETFSIKIAGRDLDRQYYPRIAAHLGIQAHVYDFGVAEFNEVYEEVLAKTDEPSADISIFPTHYVSKKARERVTVALSGEGGDELFFGYPRQRTLSNMRRARQRSGLSLLERLFLGTPTFRGKNFVFEKLFVLFRQPASFYILSLSPGRDHTDTSAWLAAKRVVTDLQDPLYYDRDLYLENALLKKADAATMCNALEGRVPLLDPLIISAAARFESAFTESNESKPILKRLLERYLPDELIYRPKTGFGISLPDMLPHSPALSRDLKEAIRFLRERSLLYAHIPRSFSVLVRRYANLCFALISLYRAIDNNERTWASALQRNDK